jgi:hypothetical protein
MRISLVTLATGEAYRAAVEPGLRSKQRYCRRHGYEFVVAGDEILDPTRPAAWSKIRLLKRELARQDLVFLSDADVVIMNPRIRLEDLQALHLSEPQHHLAMCRDPNALFSTGNILAKSHPWTFDILEAIWRNEDFIHHPWWEQAALLDLHQRNVLNAPQHVSIAPPRAFNSLPAAYGSPRNSDLNYAPGDFLVHHASTWIPRLNWHMRWSDTLRRFPPPIAGIMEKLFTASGLLHHVRRVLRRFGLLDYG